MHIVFGCSMFPRINEEDRLGSKIIEFRHVAVIEVVVRPCL